MSSPQKIAKILVQKVNSAGELEEQKVPVESFWQDKPCVIIFFRRFGCQFCRLAAKELSNTVKPVLDKHNIRLIGVGFESRFVKPFVEEGYFDGDLYVDNDKKCYEALQYKRFGYIDTVKLVFTKEWKEASAKAKSMNIHGDLKGDAFQNGGALLVDKGGKQLFELIQEDSAEHISPEQIYKAFNITA